MAFARKRTESLSSVDVAWYQMEDPTNLMMITGLIVFDEPIDYERLRATLETRLPELIAGYQEELANARVTLFLLSIQSLIFVLYTLTMISSFLLDQSQSELASLAGRGFNSGQITRIFAVEGLLLALVAAPLGPPLAAPVAPVPRPPLHRRAPRGSHRRERGPRAAGGGGCGRSPRRRVQRPARR